MPHPKPPPGIDIWLNGRPQQTTAPDLAALLALEGFAPAASATALDGQFIPRAQRAATPLRPGARIEVLSAMQGG